MNELIDDDSEFSGFNVVGVKRSRSGVTFWTDMERTGVFATGDHLTVQFDFFFGGRNTGQGHTGITGSVNGRCFNWVHVYRKDLDVMDFFLRDNRFRTRGEPFYERMAGLAG